MNLKSTATSRVEVSPAPMSVPDGGASKSANCTERAGAREIFLRRGRELAERTINRYETWCRSPHNAEQVAWLRGAWTEFERWEREAQLAGIATEKEFPDPRLRPYKSPMPDTATLARMRRTPSIAEAHALSMGLARRTERPAAQETDDGIWPSAGPGI